VDRVRTPAQVGDPGQATTGSRTASPRTKQRGLLTIGATVLLVVAAFGAMLWLTSDPERQAIIERLVQSPVGLVVLFGLAALSSATLILPAPGLALTAIAGAAASEPILVGVVAGLGQAVGELTGYAAGRSGSALLPDNVATARLTRWIATRGPLIVFVLAVIPNPVFDVAGIAAGIVRMPVAVYFVAAAAGKVIKNVVVASGAGALEGLALVVGLALR
jgi:membrane protein DedA with SNARE-associated domain